MTIRVAVVPSTPLVLDGLPGDRTAELALLGRAARAAAADLAAAELVVLLAGGEAAVCNPPATDLRGYGLPELASVAHRAAPDAAVDALRAALADGTTATPPDLRVLARLVPQGPGVVGVAVPADLATTDARALAAALADLSAAGDLAVVCAGDLAAGHGDKPPRPAATAVASRFDADVVAALDGRPADLVDVDPGLAAQAASRAVGALRVLGAVCDATGATTQVRSTGAPLGVGYVVARSA